DYDDNTHHVLDLNFLKHHDQVRFMIVYASNNASAEGILIDNFSIGEKTVDLALVSDKNLMAAQGDYRIKENIFIKNLGNYASDSTWLKIYLSADTILDGQDIFTDSVSIEALRPHQKYMAPISFQTP